MPVVHGGSTSSDANRAESVAVISSPAGWYGDWHPAPRRQLMFCLAGELEVQVSDGEPIQQIQESLTLIDGGREVPESATFWALSFRRSKVS